MGPTELTFEKREVIIRFGKVPSYCLLYTSDAADEEDSVDLGGRRIIKKKIRRKYYFCQKISGVKDFSSLIILIDR